MEQKRSCAPYGDTMSIARIRLGYDNKQDPERIMMTLWEKINTRQHYLNSGTVPLDDILHTCTEECKNVRPVLPFVPPHHYVPHDEYGVRVAAATVQWLATSCGREFYRQFLGQIGLEVRISEAPKKPITVRELPEKNTEATS